MDGLLATYDFTPQEVYEWDSGVAFMGYPNAYMSTLHSDTDEIAYYNVKISHIEVTAFNNDASGTCALYLEGYKWQDI
jgi:hypothetical protein